MFTYLVRAVRWEPAVVAALPGTVLLAWSRWAPAGWSRPSATSVLGAAAALVAIGLAFCLDDDAAVVLDAAPVSTPWRRMWHLLIGGAAAFAGSALMIALAPAATPVGWASATIVGLGAVALAVGALGGRVLGPTEASAVGAVGVVFARLAAGTLPHGWALGPNDAGASGRWLVVAAASALVLGAASRDSGSRWWAR